MFRRKENLFIFYEIVKQDFYDVEYVCALSKVVQTLKASSTIHWLCNFFHSNERTVEKDRDGSFIKIYGIWKSKKCQSGEINTRRQQRFF